MAPHTQQNLEAMVEHVGYELKMLVASSLLVAANVDQTVPVLKDADQLLSGQVLIRRLHLTASFAVVGAAGVKP